jgi:hypothetical protein
VDRIGLGKLRNLHKGGGGGGKINNFEITVNVEAGLPSEVGNEVSGSLIQAVHKLGATF